MIYAIISPLYSLWWYMSEIGSESHIQLASWGTQFLGVGRAGIQSLCEIYGQDPVFAMLVSDQLPVFMYQRTPDITLDSVLEVQRFVDSHNAVAGEDYTLVACNAGEARSKWIPTCIAQSPDYRGKIFNHLFYVNGAPIDRPVRRGIAWSELVNMVKTSRIIDGKLYFEDQMTLEFLPVDTIVIAVDMDEVYVRMIIQLLQALGDRHAGRDMPLLNILISVGNEGSHRHYESEYHRYLNGE